MHLGGNCRWVPLTNRKLGWSDCNPLGDNPGNDVGLTVAQPTRKGRYIAIKENKRRSY